MRIAIHPGEILADELKERGMTYAELARAMHMPENCVAQIVAGKQDITPAIAQHLSQCLGTSVELWTNLQNTYERDTVGKKFIPVEKLFAEWRKDPEFMKEYEALEDEFVRASALIDARASTNPTKEESTNNDD